MGTLLNAKDAARALGISERTVYRLSAAGDIPQYRVGMQLRFDEDELRIAFRRNKAKARAS
ncbi:helix-turn-helix domain-containing protein [Flexivirga alba]|uniref:Helix-turn-helix domain-containing protein n=1 Tax=Flexivirga alba TaxID=702742 RepID=A0ABW2AL82_9MICO